MLTDWLKDTSWLQVAILHFLPFFPAWQYCSSLLGIHETTWHSSEAEHVFQKLSFFLSSFLSFSTCYIALFLSENSRGQKNQHKKYPEKLKFYCEEKKMKVAAK